MNRPKRGSSDRALLVRVFDLQMSCMIPGVAHTTEAKMTAACSPRNPSRVATVFKRLTGLACHLQPTNLTQCSSHTIWAQCVVTTATDLGG